MWAEEHRLATEGNGSEERKVSSQEAVFGRGEECSSLGGTDPDGLQDGNQPEDFVDV